MYKAFSFKGNAFTPERVQNGSSHMLKARAAVFRVQAFGAFKKNPLFL